MQFVNPLADPIFIKVVYACVGLLIVALLYTLGVERGRLRQLPHSSMFQRLISAAVLVPLAVACIFAGPGMITVMVILMSVICTVEYVKVTRLAKMFLAPVLCAALAVPLATGAAPQLVLPLVVFALLAIGTIAVVRFGKTREEGSITAAATAASGAYAQAATPYVIQQAGLSALAVLYAPLLGSFVIRVGQLTAGSGLVLALMATVSMADTLAYVVGKRFGRTKLAPHVSPNKTVAGAVGAVVGAYGGFLLMQFACPDLPLWVLITVPLLAAVLGIAGDLFESVIKRSYQVKDAGSWLPGVGGLLDRVDSLLFVFPAAYFVLSLAL